MTRQQSLLDDELIRQHVPLMAAAARHIGHYSTRSRGTVGGSLANADPSSELALVAVTLGAELTIRGPAQTRIVAGLGFLPRCAQNRVGADRDPHRACRRGCARTIQIAFHEHARRHGDFAIASAAAQLSPDQGVLRAGLGALGPLRCCADGSRIRFARQVFWRRWTIPSLRRSPTWMRCRTSTPAPTTAASLPPSACPTASESWSREGTSETTVAAGRRSPAADRPWPFRRRHPS